MSGAELTKALVQFEKALRLEPGLADAIETLVADQEGTTRRVLEFCGLPWDDACLRFHEIQRADGTISADQVRQPICQTAVGRADRFGALREALAE